MRVRIAGTRTDCDGQRRYHKSSQHAKDSLRPLLGHGILMSEGELWKVCGTAAHSLSVRDAVDARANGCCAQTQRRLLSPAFHFDDLIASCVAARCALVAARPDPSLQRASHAVGREPCVGSPQVRRRRFARAVPALRGPRQLCDGRAASAGAAPPMSTFMRQAVESIGPDSLDVDTVPREWRRARSLRQKRRRVELAARSARERSAAGGHDGGHRACWLRNVFSRPARS
jgi:hypothetical protein